MPTLCRFDAMNDPKTLLRLEQLERRCARLEDVLFQRLAAEDRADEFPALATHAQKALPTDLSPPWAKRGGAPAPDPFVGMYAYWPMNDPQYQGVITAMSEDGIATVQLFSWWTGEVEGHTEILPSETFPIFSPTRAEMLRGLYYDKYTRDPLYADSVGTLREFLAQHGEQVPA
jgi:hypothetical protein